jgi:hypothetical protein
MRRITLWGLALAMVLELISASRPLLAQQGAASILSVQSPSGNAREAFGPRQVDLWTTVLDAARAMISRSTETR